MPLEFDGSQIEAAAGAALGRDPGEDELVRELADPDGLAVRVALELARSLVPEAVDVDGLTDGATAFLWGLLVAANLTSADQMGAGPLLDDDLVAGISFVTREGRQAVIARHCDLGAVAGVERVVGAALRRRRGRAEEILQSLLQLFELGLAVGLAARYA
jgi:hypothetical protein